MDFTLTQANLLPILAIVAGILNLLSPRGVGPYFVALWLIVYGLFELRLIDRFLT